MAYAILRTEKLKTAGNLGGLNAHLTRTMDVPNADPALAKYNSRPIGTADLRQDVEARLAIAGITPRKNAVLAIEHLITASPDAFNYRKNAEGQLVGNVEDWKKFEKTSLEWLRKRYGADNVVNFTVHKDESTPHIHAVVVPIDKKGKLNCRSYLGGKEKLSEMQSSFADAVKELGLERGVKGSKAKHQTISRFYGSLSQESERLQAEPLQVTVTAPERIKTFLGSKFEREPDVHAMAEGLRINQEIEEWQKRTVSSVSKELSRSGGTRVLEQKVKALEATNKSLEKHLNNTLNAAKTLYELIFSGASLESIREQVNKMYGQKKEQQQERKQGYGRKRGGGLGMG